MYAIAAQLLPVAACGMPIAAINGEGARRRSETLRARQHTTPSDSAVGVMAADVCEAAFIAAKDYRSGLSQPHRPTLPIRNATDPLLLRARSLPGSGALRL